LILAHLFPRSDLTSNRLTSISSSALFSNLVNLRTVSLSTNSIASFDPLPSLPVLTGLALRINQLTALTAGQFTGATALKSLYVFSQANDFLRF
jgi:Leucine-rich repeat (LRR) protein